MSFISNVLLQSKLLHATTQRRPASPSALRCPTSLPDSNFLAQLKCYLCCPCGPRADPQGSVPPPEALWSVGTAAFFTLTSSQQMAGLDPSLLCRYLAERSSISERRDSLVTTTGDPSSGRKRAYLSHLTYRLRPAQGLWLQGGC